MFRKVDVAEDDVHAPYDNVDPLFVTGRHFRSRTPVRQTLYHYTTASGLVGIVTSGCLRATNFSFLNDSSEFRYGLDVVLGVLRDEEARVVDPVERACLEKTRAIFESAGNTSEIYVACFSDKRDRLSQWRAYGSAGPTAGFCIAFDGERVSNTAMQSVFRLDRVIYEKSEQIERALYLIGSSLTRFDSLATPSEDYIELTARDLADRLLEIAAFFKDSHFVEENEYRAVCDGPDLDQVEFETTSDRIRPYVHLVRAETFDEKRLPIVEITFATLTRPEQVRKSIRLLLQRYGYVQTSIIQTQIPF